MVTPDTYEFCLVTSQFSRMNVLTIFFVILMAQHTLLTVVSHSDPSACQRIIKFMLISACGAKKREFRTSPMYQDMTEEEIEKRYYDMVQAKMIKGVERNYVENNDWVWEAIDDLKDADYNEFHHKPFYQRLKRSVIGIGLGGSMKTLLDAAEHERRGSFHFIGRLPPERDDREERAPAPGELKTKCCGGVILCTMDDFRGFCE